MRFHPSLQAVLSPAPRAYHELRGCYIENGRRCKFLPAAGSRVSETMKGDVTPRRSIAYGVRRGDWSSRGSLVEGLAEKKRWKERKRERCLALQKYYILPLWQLVKKYLTVDFVAHSDPARNILFAKVRLLIYNPIIIVRNIFWTF